MLFQKRFHRGLRDGSIDRSYRSWKTAKVRTGNQYRFAVDGAVEVTGLNKRTIREITDPAAQAAGFADRAELIAYLSRAKSPGPSDTDEVFVSIEAVGGDELQQRTEGIEAVRGKSTWWYDNHEVHSSSAAGPFCGHREDQFAVYFEMDLTNKPSGERRQSVEVGIYTVANDKIVEEEFWYLMG